MKKILFICLFIFPLLSSCGGGDSTTTTISKERGSLISATHITSVKSRLLPYDVDAYKLIYYTIGTTGNIIKASGLLSIPKKGSTQKSPMLSYQHGTIFLDTLAPSNNRASILGINTLAATGYIVSAPDYIGYGESASTIHPYLHAKSLATSSIDMLRASLRFVKTNSIKINKQLFLTGYSEGGYATLAMQKAIQEHYASEFTVTASAAGAGPFDLTTSAKILANKTYNNSPAYMSFLLKAYDSIYQLDQISDMYQAPYQSIINLYFDGKHSTSEINNSLSHDNATLFKPDFLHAIQGSGKHIFNDKLLLNNIYDWRPTAPTRFFHSESDEIVPYSNAVKALDTMEKNGASDVSLGTCGFNTHTACVLPYVLDAASFFSNYSEDL